MPEGAGTGYRCSFVSMSSGQQFRPRRATAKPFVQGPQTAVVVGPGGDEIYTDKYGRVKVQFHWDRYGKKRSEEHTSELQSHLNLVCRLLLEKKKKNTAQQLRRASPISHGGA